MVDAEPRRTDPIDLLAAYELGLLDDDDRAAFEAALLDNPDLLDELYDGAVDAIALAATPGRFAAAARAGSRQARAADRISPLERLRGWLQPRVLVPATTIATLALATALLWPAEQVFDPGRLVSLEPLAVVTVDTRADAASADQRYAAALTSYDRGLWSAAAAELTATLDEAGTGWSHRDQANLYLGSSLLLAGDVRQALGPLSDASASRLAPVRDRARWNLAQAHLLLADATAAREALSVLVSSPVYGDRASDLLGRLGAEP